MIKVVGEPFDVLLLHFNKPYTDEVKKAKEFLQSKGIENVKIDPWYALELEGIDWMNKRVLVMITDCLNPRNLEIFSNKIGSVNASCKKGKGHFLCYNAANDHSRIAAECATTAKLGNYLYLNDPSYDTVFEAWKQRCTIEALNSNEGAAVTPLFRRIFKPASFFALMAIVAVIFAARRRYFTL